jgi:hypothetical protein
VILSTLIPELFRDRLIAAGKEAIRLQKQPESEGYLAARAEIDSITDQIKACYPQLFLTK